MSFSVASVRSATDGQLEANIRSGTTATERTVKSTIRDPVGAKLIRGRSVEKRKLYYTTFMGDRDS